jgi:hypothetical protein
MAYQYVIIGVGKCFHIYREDGVASLVSQYPFYNCIVVTYRNSFFKDIPWYFTFFNINYVIFFVFLFLELLRFLLKPGYINSDIISASVCGYFLLIEISTFLLQTFEYHNPHSFKGIDTSSSASIFIDLVYFCSITFTSIGFGDITPNMHITKLITAFIGIGGQFYTVVLVGILISKFSSKN